MAVRQVLVASRVVVVLEPPHTGIRELDVVLPQHADNLAVMQEVLLDDVPKDCRATGARNHVAAGAGGWLKRTDAAASFSMAAMRALRVYASNSSFSIGSQRRTHTIVMKNR